MVALTTTRPGLTLQPPCHQVPVWPTPLQIEATGKLSPLRMHPGHFPTGEKFATKQRNPTILKAEKPKNVAIEYISE